jgi:hypothetical protein
LRDSSEPPNLVFEEFWSQTTVLVLMVEDVVDRDEHLAGDCDDGSVVSSTFHDSHIELVESGVVACGLVGGFDEDPPYVAVSFLRDRDRALCGCRIGGCWLRGLQDSWRYLIGSCSASCSRQFCLLC